MCASRFARSCLVSLAASVGAIGVAAAQVSPAQDPPANLFEMKTPPDWPESPELASGIAKQLAKSVDFGGLEKNGGAAAFVKPQTGIIYVTWLLTSEPAPDPERAVRTTLDQLRGAPGGPSVIEELEYDEKRVGQAIDIRMIWRHLANETITMSRALAWKDQESKLRLLRAECLFSESDKPEVAPVCATALETLAAAEITSGKAGELGAIAGPGAQVESGAGADGGAVAPREAPSIQAVDPNKPLYQRERDKKSGAVRGNLWLFIVGGVLIVFALWAATRGRREGEEEGGGEGDGAAGRGAGEEEE